ncbi:oxidoreductase [Actinoplanes sp. NBC_00393]|uniref:oxidoreductase n=1 Tax=Actinoplanes sp. NBC_00393 TaxID=2975953 RepID=UPI002E1A1896
MSIAVVTGGNSGIGFHTARELAGRGIYVVITARDPERGAAAAAEIVGATWAQLDLADLDSVHRFAERFRAEHGRLDLLINNAGVMALPRQLTEDGFERQFGTNHLGHFALTGLLLPLLLTTDHARVVTVTSGLHKRGRIDFDDLMGERRYGRFRAYTQSKLANVLFALELHRRSTAAGVPLLSVLAHPGVAHTNLARSRNPLANLVVAAARLSAQSAADGALPLLHAATAEDVRGGDAFGPDGFAERRGAPTRVAVSARGRDEPAARRLWTISEELTGVRFPAFEQVRSRDGGWDDAATAGGSPRPASPRPGA